MLDILKVELLRQLRQLQWRRDQNFTARAELFEFLLCPWCECLPQELHSGRRLVFGGSSSSARLLGSFTDVTEHQKLLVELNGQFTSWGNDQGFEAVSSLEHVEERCDECETLSGPGFSQDDGVSLFEQNWYSLHLDRRWPLVACAPHPLHEVLR